MYRGQRSALGVNSQVPSAAAKLPVKSRAQLEDGSEKDRGASWVC